MSDIDKLEQILSLLKNSYTSTNSSQLLEISKLLNILSKDLNMYIEVLFQGLYSNSFNDEEITKELHQSLAVNLKNIIEEKKSELNNEQIIYIIKKIFGLYFPKIVHQNLLKDSLINTFQYILTTLLSSLWKKDNNYDFESLFNLLLCNIKKEFEDKNELIIYQKIVIKFIKGIFDSEPFVNENNFDKIINVYYFDVLDIVFNNVHKYIDPEKNMFSEDYLIILDELIEDMYINMNNIGKIESIDKVKYFEVYSNMFKKYGKIIYELIKIQLPLDEESKQVFNNQNPIISFNLSKNESLCSKINTMKSKCFQFISFSIQKLSIKLQEKSNSSLIIQDQSFIELFVDLMKLVIKSLEDILSNKGKFHLIKISKEGIFTSYSNYNNLLYQMFLYLNRCLLRDPIKKEFSSYIKYFILNILFPLATFEESEKMFMEEDPETYNNYINDILYDFKFRNFRTSLCFLIKKIFDNYDECNVVLNYIVEMLMYLFDKSSNNINSDLSTYSNYLSEENKSVINNFNDEIKIDFCFLIILLLRDKIEYSYNLLNKFISFFVLNQEKIHQINSKIILVKVCEIYKQYFEYFFKEYKDDEINLIINFKSSFIENALNFLLNIIINLSPNNQSKNQNNQNTPNSLVTKASDTLITIISYVKKNKSDGGRKNNLNIILSDKIRCSFKKLIELINIYYNSATFMSVLSRIISDIKIDQREDIYTCLKILTNKFISIINNNPEENSFEKETKNKIMFINQYFAIIKNFLSNENNIKPSEIKIFNDIMMPIISCIEKPNEYEFTDDIIEIGEYYIKCTNNIDEISIKILDNIYPLIIKEKTICGNYYSFISTFLSYINMTNIMSLKNYLNYIFKIIKTAYSFENDSEYKKHENILYTLLLTMQILSFDKSVYNNDDIKYVILENIKLCIKYFSLGNNYEEDEYSSDSDKIKEKIQQLLLCNLSNYFMFYSEILLFILVNNFMNIFNGINEINNICEFLVKLYSTFNSIDGNYFPILYKNNIICLCYIFSNKNISDIIMDNITKKKEMFKLLFNLVKQHKVEKKKFNKKLTDKEIRCDFIECEESEENEEDSNDFDDQNKDFEEIIKNAIKNYENIVKYDEFKIFNETFQRMKNENENLVNEMINGLSREEIVDLYNLLQIRNVQVDYNGTKIELPRRTLKIKRNIN